MKQTERQHLYQLIERAWKDGYNLGRGLGRFDPFVDEAWDKSVAKRLIDDLRNRRSTKGK